MAKFAITVIMKGTNDNKCAKSKVKHQNVVYNLEMSRAQSCLNMLK